MRTSLDIVCYQLPLKNPWSSAHGQFQIRYGWLIIARTGTAIGYGDCAPLPAAGTESFKQAWQRLRYWRWCAHHCSVENLLEQLTAALPSRSPAADCAVETALLDLQARQHGCSLRQLLSPNVVDVIPVNAALGPLSPTIPEQITTLLNQGYRVLKFKLGLAPAVTEFIKLRRLVVGLPQDVSLRLDVNQAWNFETALIFITALQKTFCANCDNRPLSSWIESIEEPLIQATDTHLARLQTLANFPLAIDESLLQTSRQWPINPATIPVKRLVLKPSVIGGLRPTFALACRAITIGREVVLTSLIESAAGLWSTAQLTAAIIGFKPQYPALAHGLSTATWLAQDLGVAPQPQKDMILLPNVPGSGFQPFLKP
jgi:o-succinylbenzoate synthase